MPAAAVDSHIQPGSSGPALDPVETAVAEGVAKVGTDMASPPAKYRSCLSYSTINPLAYPF